MTREQLEHIIRAASDITGDPDIVVIGSQAILGTYPQAPETLLRSREADVYPLHKPDDAVLIDANMGELSLFDEEFRYYAHGVGPATATLPEGWERRLVPVNNENTGGATGWCLEIHDLLLAKVAAGRGRDWSFVEETLRHELADPDVLRARMPTVPLQHERLPEVRRLLEAAITRARRR
jgi:Nucleotidyltransferase of unknown function (DUF6036)